MNYERITQLSSKIEFKNIKKIKNKNLTEYYIKSKALYNYTVCNSFDKRNFGFIINKYNNKIVKGFYFLRELNDDYFLLSRLSKNIESSKQKQLYILPINHNNNIQLWSAMGSEPLMIGEVSGDNIVANEKFNKIMNKHIDNPVKLIINENTLGNRFEKMLFNNLSLNELFEVSRIPYTFQINNSKAKNKCNKDEWCFLNSYTNKNNNKTNIDNTIKQNFNNLYELKIVNKRINIFKTNYNSYTINDYINDFNNIIYYGHGYSEKDSIMIDLSSDKVKLLFDSTISKDKTNGCFIFLACNESIKMPEAEFNTITSLFNIGFSEVLITESKVEVEIINITSIYLIILAITLGSFSKGLKILNRLKNSIIPVYSPFRLYSKY